MNIIFRISGIAGAYVCLKSRKTEFDSWGIHHEDVAQQVKHLTFNQKSEGSSLSIFTMVMQFSWQNASLIRMQSLVRVKSLPPSTVGREVMRRSAKPIREVRVFYSAPCDCSIMVIIPVFQTEDVSSILTSRSKIGVQFNGKTLLSKSKDDSSILSALANFTNRSIYRYIWSILVFVA